MPTPVPSLDVPFHCPSRYDPDYNRMVVIQKSPLYAVRGPGQYIIRDSSLNHGARKLVASGMPVTYLAFEYWSEKQGRSMNVLLTWNPDAHVWTLDGHAVGYPTLRHLKGAFPSLMVTAANPACAFDEDVPTRASPSIASYDAPRGSSVGVGLLVRAMEGNLNDLATRAPSAATAGVSITAAAAGDFYIMPPPAPVLGPKLSRDSSRGSASSRPAGYLTPASVEAAMLPMPPPKARVLSRLASDSSHDSTTAYTVPPPTSLFH